MLTYDEILNMNFYQSTPFTGWYKEMRFLIQKETTDDATACFHVWFWRGPYIFELTPEDAKTDTTFPFTEEGRKQCVDWLNENYNVHFQK